ncbi:MAG: Ig-like domain-containing protein, partial [Candidatus Eremiobacteraeota bacterium]|nr:Ig-like domain-containing protein [Candidatus Eremiobacteraeota bacterium]
MFTGTTAAASRALTFNFLRAQEAAALSVPADTTQIRFRFYSGVGGGGALLQEELRDFAASITIDPVHVATQSYVITALSTQGYPLLEITANLASSESEVDFSGLNPVAVTPERLTLTPASTTVEVGQSAQFESFVLFSNGETVAAAATDVTWDATFQATIDAQGLATGTADGISTVTATFRTVTATANMVIGQGLLLTRLEVTPDNASVGLGSDIPFSVVGFDQNDNPFDLNALTVVWSATGDASIDAVTGVATGDSVVPNTLAGSATITATIDTLSDSTNLTVIALPGNLLSVTTTPDPLTIDLDNPTGNLSTSGDFQNGPDQVLTNAQHGLLYSVTGNPGVASVNVVTGEVTAIAQGTTEVTATAGGQSDTVMVQVNFGAAGNQAPSVTVSSAPVNLGGTGATPVTAFPAATVADPTQASFVGGTLTIEALAPGNQDVVIALPATPDIGTIQTNNAASVSIDLTTSATEAQVQALLRGVTVFANSIGTADLQISLDDGQGATGTASRSFVAATGSLTLAAGAHTYDTDTGALDGVVDT